MENLKIKSVYHFNKNEIEYIRQKYQIKNEIPEKTEVINSDIQIISNHNSKIIKTIFPLDDTEKEIIKKRFSTYNGAENDFSINSVKEQFPTDSNFENNFSTNYIEQPFSADSNIENDFSTNYIANTSSYDTSNEIIKEPKKKAVITALIAVAVLGVAGVAALAVSNAIGTPNSDNTLKGTESTISSVSTYEQNNISAVEEKNENTDAQGECGENASYKLIGNTLYIEGTGTVDGNSEASTSCFKYLPNEIENIIISDGITGIGEYAFESCGSLKNITIPESVNAIGLCAFRYCKSLESITMPDTVTKIEDEAFEGCTSLKAIVIPSNVTEINNYSFADCEKLESITIPSSVTYIGDYAFKGCDKLTINGEKGSAAEAYANNRNIKFKSI